MTRSCLALIALALLAPPAWSGAPFQRKELERDLELTVLLRSPKIAAIGRPFLADLRITNHSKAETCPMVLPSSGGMEGVTEPYVWFTARIKPVGELRWLPVKRI